MNCEEAHRLLDAYLDRELDLRRRLELEQHLSLCLSCQSLAQELEEFQLLFLASAQTSKAPPQLRANVSAAVRRERAKHSFAFLRQPWVYAAAVVVLSLFLALNILLPDARGELSRHAVLRLRSLAPDHPVDVCWPPKKEHLSKRNHFIEGYSRLHLEQCRVQLHPRFQVK
jgi:anti-sigma factor RsiW